ncbi:hypothetical protein SYNPS1DRAFT_24548 [Syncephalis pseudoplumigaleata]|uniref:THH1/TOM1/TOM3 domain-containing protein n=1 Tax=Syncephalis pseudoplumigaleata TaxID=1712513 RepID=A0A4P9YU99_9FUNG|nr:hypothetical protein SYNPS1DRAFT_24548 [Syncephalis pseudoplumigaleata]|eukprot:RKP23394.1 hypothetical protein SYNPS1DRAFT_24548 [Syncephalis pseudoplumigaleata]
MRPYNNDTLCHTSTNIYDCDGSDTFFFSTLLCVAAEAVSTLVGCGVLFYRWRKRLSVKVFRRIDGYWMPVPMDSLLVVILLAGIFRLVHYVLILLDRPNSWAARELAHTVILAQTLFPQVLFTMGIVTSLPPMLIRQSVQRGLPFSRRPVRGYRSNDTLREAAPPLPPQQHQHQDSQELLTSAAKLYVPSIAVIFWVGVCFSAYLYLANGAFAVWSGLSEDANDAAASLVAGSVWSASMCITMSVLLVVNSYYCYGVYRILHRHLSRPYVHEQRDDEMDVVSRLRSIFLALFTVLALTIGYTLTASYRRTGGVTPHVWKVFVYVFYFGLLYPGAQLYINHIIAHHSIAQARRMRNSASDSDASRATPAAEMNQADSCTGPRLA